MDYDSLVLPFEKYVRLLHSNHSSSDDVMFCICLARSIHQVPTSHGKPQQWGKMFQMQKHFLRRGNLFVFGTMKCIDSAKTSKHLHGFS